MRVTIEATLEQEGVPEDRDVFYGTGGAFYLKTGCARQLIEDHACPPDTIELEEPFFEGGYWRIRGSGESGKVVMFSTEAGRTWPVEGEPQ